jgi:hypothetical protein
MEALRRNRGVAHAGCLRARASCGSGSVPAALQKLGRDRIDIELNNGHDHAAGKRPALPQGYRMAA